MNENTVGVVFMLLVFMFALTFCGSPDLHDNLIEMTKPEPLKESN